MTTYVDVWHEPDVAEGSAPVTISLTYQASKIDHPPSYTVTLDENPKRVKFYNAPPVVGAKLGDQRLSFTLPSARTWGTLQRFDDLVWDETVGAARPSGAGWVTIEGRAMQLHFSHPQHINAPPPP